ncbi:peroxide stress protein YaaA [Dysgonomonas sp. OttesenSCG-928-M03]|nr:peroxide stress protein YaaA [Dysgonomonas sp. OttesenSCG-928-M03]
MIITLSPAKMMDFANPATIKKNSCPEFEKDAEYLNDLLKDWSVDDIRSAMSINPKMAHEVYQYIHSFDMSRTPRKQAALAYNGIAYLGLEAETFSKADWDFAQNHLISLSGMYGALRPMDLIKPYRLEAQIKVQNDRGVDLYAYWKDTITTYLSERLREDDNVWVNLASNEYSKMVDKKALPKDVTIITPVFKEQRGNGYKTIVVYAKKARGVMSRFIIQNKLKKVDDLKSFDVDGYSFSPDLSKKNEWVFVR